MLIPAKDENLEKNILVIGSSILKILKKERALNSEMLFQLLRKVKAVSIDQFYNALTFLWLAELIENQDCNIFYKTDVST